MSDKKSEDKQLQTDEETLASDSADIEVVEETIEATNESVNMQEQGSAEESQPIDNTDIEIVEESIETTDESANMQEQGSAEESTAADNAEIEATDKINKAADMPVNAHAQEPDKKKNGHRILLFLLIMVAVLAGSLATSGQLQPLYHSLSSWVAGLSARSAAPPPQAKLAISEKVQQLLEKMDGMQAALSRMAEAQKQLPPAAPADDTAEKLRNELAEVANLLNTLSNDTIANLSSQLNQVAETQQAVQTSLLEQQKINLQVRLRWITDPASRLPQVKLAWEEISLLAGLTEEQHSKADEMHKLARNNILKLHQWQDSIRTWANRLAPPLHKDILPKLDQPWLDWAIGQFHLRPAPSRETRNVSRLKIELVNIANNLTTETWPAERNWQRLRAQLVLQARAGNSAEAVELNLPDSFEAIKTDIDTLQQTAQQWLGQS